MSFGSAGTRVISDSLVTLCVGVKFRARVFQAVMEQDMHFFAGIIAARRMYACWVILGAMFGAYYGISIDLMVLFPLFLLAIAAAPARPSRPHFRRMR